MAWVRPAPEATGYTCAVDGDGRSIGSAIVFRDKKGVEQGRQRLSRLERDRVEYRLYNRGPGGRRMAPEVDFRLEPVAGRTRVHLDFRAEVPLPAGPRHGWSSSSAAGSAGCTCSICSSSRSMWRRGRCRMEPDPHTGPVPTRRVHDQADARKADQRAPM